MMPDKKETSHKKHPIHAFGRFIKKNGFTVLMGSAMVIMLVSPDAKSWVLRQLMVTGIFNAKIDNDGNNAMSQPAISFDFEDEKGNIQNTNALRGKVVFINFWASWCPPCRAEFPSIEALYAKSKSDPAVFFLMINEDQDRSAAKRYIQKEGFTLPFYKVIGKVPEVVYTGTLPTTIILDKTGKIRFQHTGFADYGSDKFFGQIKQLIQE